MYNCIIVQLIVDDVSNIETIRTHIPWYSSWQWLRFPSMQPCQIFDFVVEMASSLISSGRGDEVPRCAKDEAEHQGRSIPELFCLFFMNNCFEFVCGFKVSYLLSQSFYRTWLVALKHAWLRSKGSLTLHKVELFYPYNPLHRFVHFLQAQQLWQSRAWIINWCQRLGDFGDNQRMQLRMQRKKR